MKIKILRATKLDIPKVAKLAEAFEEESYKMIDKKNKYHLELEESIKNPSKKIEKDLYQELKNRNYQILVAKDGKEIIGYFTFSIRKGADFAKLKKHGRLNFAYIKKEYRGKGIFKSFIKEAKKWFKKKNVKIVTLQTLISNKRAKRIYYKMGFKDMVVDMVGKLR